MAKTIRPVSDLRNNFADISRTVHETSQPVFLTKNGRGKYVIVDYEDYEKKQAAMKLLSELLSAEEEADREGWLSSEDVERELGLI